MEQSFSVNEAKFHPISCRHCKRLHKVCSKELPACSGCQWRNVECVYDAPQKKGRVSKRKEFEKKKTAAQSSPSLATSTTSSTSNGKVVSSPSSSGSSSSSNASTHNNHSNNNSNNGQSSAIPYEPVKNPVLDQNHLSWTRLIDIYYGDFFDDNHMIEREDFERCIYNYDDESVYIPNKREVMAMGLALKAHIEQSLCFSGSEETANQARDALSKVFDNSNFYVACAYYYFANYEIGYGRFRNARFYLKCLDFYFEEQQEESLTQYQKNLRKSKQFLATESRGESSLKTILADWYDIYEKYLGISLPPTWKDLINQDLTQDNYLTVLNMIDAMINVGRMHLKDSGNIKRLKMYDELADYIYHGIRIRILSELGRGREMIEESALKITLKTESENFIFGPSFIVTPIAIACKVHLHIAKSIEMGERQNCNDQNSSSLLGPIDYYQILAKDLRAIKTLAKRFKKVNLVHNAMMKEMESIIDRKQFYNALTVLMSSNNNNNSSGETFLNQPQVNNSVLGSSEINGPTDEMGHINTAREYFQFLTSSGGDVDQTNVAATNMHPSGSSSSLESSSSTVGSSDSILLEQRKKEYEQNVNSFLTNFPTQLPMMMEGTIHHQHHPINNDDSFEGYINYEEIHQLFNIRYDDSSTVSSFLGSEQ